MLPYLPILCLKTAPIILYPWVFNLGDYFLNSHSCSAYTTLIIFYHLFGVNAVDINSISCHNHFLQLNSVLHLSVGSYAEYASKVNSTEFKSSKKLT